jgi:hypothetical protein
MQQIPLFPRRRKIAAKATGPFAAVNHAAVKIISENPVEYSGLPLDWAHAVLDATEITPRLQALDPFSTTQSDFANSRNIPDGRALANSQPATLQGFAAHQKEVKSI